MNGGWMMINKRLYGIGTLLILVGICQADEKVLINAVWDSGERANSTFSKMENTWGGKGKWDQATGVITSTRRSNKIACKGISSDTAIDFSMIGEDSLVLTARVVSRPRLMFGNGIFIGFQNGEGGDGTMLWNNNQPSFGLVISGGDYNGVYHVAPGGKGPQTSEVKLEKGFQGTDFGVASEESVCDGFSVVITINKEGWNFVIKGLEMVGSGSAITGGSGTWADVDVDGKGVNWDDLTASSTMHAALSSQGNGGEFTIGQMTVVQQHSGKFKSFPLPVITAIRRVGNTMEVDATNLVSGIKYQLVRSIEDTITVEVVGEPIIPNSDTKTFVDSAPSETQAYYQVRVVRTVNPIKKH
jgi:hypothetical protein